MCTPHPHQGIQFNNEEYIQSFSHLKEFLRILRTKTERFVKRHLAVLRRWFENVSKTEKPFLGLDSFSILKHISCMCHFIVELAMMDIFRKPINSHLLKYPHLLSWNVKIAGHKSYIVVIYKVARSFRRRNLFPLLLSMITTKTLGCHCISIEHYTTIIIYLLCSLVFA